VGGENREKNAQSSFVIGAEVVIRKKKKQKKGKPGPQHRMLKTEKPETSCASTHENTGKK